MRHTGVLECVNIVKTLVLHPADMDCLTCMINQGNMGTYQALKKALTIDKEEPTIFTKKEFAIWANSFHYLEEQCLEADTWNRLKWLEYYHHLEEPTNEVSPTQYCSGPEGDLRNVQKICPYCLQVPPACIKWLVDHNPTKMFSHVFAIKGSPKWEDENWVKDEAWLHEHHEEYDAAYQGKEMAEQEYVEHLHHLQHARGLLELHEKTKNTMSGAVNWTGWCDARGQVHYWTIRAQGE
jgi:hypothetical protein